MKKCLAFVSEGGWSDGIFVFLFFEGTIFLLFLKVTFLQQKNVRLLRHGLGLSSHLLPLLRLPQLRPPPQRLLSTAP